MTKPLVSLSLILSLIFSQLGFSAGKQKGVELLEQNTEQRALEQKASCLASSLGIAVGLMTHHALMNYVWKILAFYDQQGMTPLGFPKNELDFLVFLLLWASTGPFIISAVAFPVSFIAYSCFMRRETKKEKTP